MLSFHVECGLNLLRVLAIVEGPGRTMAGARKEQHSCMGYLVLLDTACVSHLLDDLCTIDGECYNGIYFLVTIPVHIVPPYDPTSPGVGFGYQLAGTLFVKEGSVPVSAPLSGN